MQAWAKRYPNELADLVERELPLDALHKGERGDQDEREHSEERDLKGYGMNEECRTSQSLRIPPCLTSLNPSSQTQTPGPHSW